MIEWVGHELFPKELEWPDRTPAPEPPANRPKTLTRFEFLLVADNIEMPIAEKPKKMRTFNAHEAIEYAKTEGVANQLVEALYRAYWESGLEINNPEIIRQVATGIVTDLDALDEAVKTERFKDKIVPFDDVSYSLGVYNVPTFFIGEERYAEQPYSALRKAAQTELVQAALAQATSATSG